MEWKQSSSLVSPSWTNNKLIMEVDEVRRIQTPSPSVFRDPMIYVVSPPSTSASSTSDLQPKEMSAQTQPQVDEPNNNILKSATPYSDATQTKKQPTDDHIKRPMNSFMVWSQEQRRQLATEAEVGVHHAQVSKSLGARWKTLTDEQKQPYVDEAEHLRQLHLLEYPGYKYRPKKKNGQNPRNAVVSNSSGKVIKKRIKAKKQQPKEIKAFVSGNKKLLENKPPATLVQVTDGENTNHFQPTTRNVLSTTRTKVGAPSSQQLLSCPSYNYLPDSPESCSSPTSVDLSDRNLVSQGDNQLSGSNDLADFQSYSPAEIVQSIPTQHGSLFQTPPQSPSSTLNHLSFYNNVGCNAAPLPGGFIGHESSPKLEASKNVQPVESVMPDHLCDFVLDEREKLGITEPYKVQNQSMYEFDSSLLSCLSPNTPFSELTNTQSLQMSPSQSVGFSNGFCLGTSQNIQGEASSISIPQSVVLDVNLDLFPEIDDAQLRSEVSDLLNCNKNLIDRTPSSTQEISSTRHVHSVPFSRQCDPVLTSANIGSYIYEQ